MNHLRKSRARFYAAFGSTDPFSVLGINRQTPEDEAKKAYLNLVKKHHPDRAGGSAAKIQDINTAWDEYKKIKANPHMDRGPGFGSQHSGRSQQPHQQDPFGFAGRQQSYYQQQHAQQQHARAQADAQAKRDAWMGGASPGPGGYSNTQWEFYSSDPRQAANARRIYEAMYAQAQAQQRARESGSRAQYGAPYEDEMWEERARKQQADAEEWYRNQKLAAKARVRNMFFQFSVFMFFVWVLHRILDVMLNPSSRGL